MLEAGLGVGPGSPFSEEEDNASPNGGRPGWKNEKYWEDLNEVLYF